MLKKIIAGAAGATLVLTMAGAAFAHPWHHHSSDDVTVVNDATVRNRTLTVANTGNLGGGGHTGNAVAGSSITNLVNTTVVGI